MNAMHAQTAYACSYRMNSKYETKIMIKNL